MRTRSRLLGGIGVLVLAAAWWALAPTAVGGHATYVVTHGNSMEPRLYTGDLAIVYPAGSYRVGQVAAYHSDLLDTTVLHRIVARTGDRFVLAGDNNSWRDPEHPTEGQIIGRQVLRVPHGGQILGWLHQPLVTGVLAALILSAGTSHQLRRRRRRRAPTVRTLMPTPPRLPAHLRDQLLATSLLAGVLFAVLATIAYLTPVTTTADRQLTWTDEVQYRYSATAQPSTVYPTGEVASGETVFRRLVDRLQLRAGVSLDAEAAHRLRGTIALSARLRSDNGWSHTLPLAAPQAFTGDRSSLTATLDLNRFDKIASKAATLTGIAIGNYTVQIEPTLRLAGTIANQPLRAVVLKPKPLVLQVTPDTIQPVAGDQSSAATTDKPEIPPVSTRHAITLSQPGPRYWSLLNQRVPVSTVRTVALAGFVTSTLAALVLWRRRAAQPGGHRVAARYQRMIIPVASVDTTHIRATVEVDTITALAHIAEKYNRLILHSATTDSYYVEDEGTLFLYSDPITRRDIPSTRRLAAGEDRSTDAKRA